MRSLLLLAIVSATGLSSTRSTAADTEEQQRALVLFDKGRKLAREGRCADAIAPLLESVRAVEGVGPLLNLGNCYETLGKIASAHKYFVRAQDVAAAHDDKRRDEAAQRAKSIEKDVSMLIVHIPSSIRNVAEVHIDGESLPKDHWDTPTPIDPGPHDIEVIAPPNPKQQETVTVRGKGDRVEWTAPVPTTTPTPTTTQKTASSNKGPSGAVSQVPDKSTDKAWESTADSSSTQRTLGLVTGGVGIVGLTIGGIFGVISLSAHASVTGRCPTYPRCPGADRPSLDSMNDNATSAGTISTIAVIAGAVLLIGGAALYFTAPSPRETRSAH